MVFEKKILNYIRLCKALCVSCFAFTFILWIDGSNAKWFVQWNESFSKLVTKGIFSNDAKFDFHYATILYFADLLFFFCFVFFFLCDDIISWKWHHHSFSGTAQWYELTRLSMRILIPGHYKTVMRFFFFWFCKNKHNSGQKSPISHKSLITNKIA